MGEYKIETYTVPEVAQKLGITKGELYNSIDKGAFPFPIILIGERRWLVPRKPVDDFLNGKKPHSQPAPWKRDGRGRPRRWKPDDTVHYNFPISKDLHERFSTVCEYQNSLIDPPLTKADWLRIAMEEFIQRRPLPEDNAAADS